jgi:pantetheine-phosphate adenylyltransferase
MRFGHGARGAAPRRGRGGRRAWLADPRAGQYVVALAAFGNETSSMSRSALYPGSFDPPTLGHFDLIERGRSLFDHLVVAVGVNPQKSPLLAAEERMAMLRRHARGAGTLEVVSFSGLVVDCARRHGLTTIMRGLRTVSDFENEYQMALTNRALNPAIETIFVMANEKYAYVSSRLIKEVFAMGGDAGQFLTPEIAARLLELRKGMEE